MTTCKGRKKDGTPCRSPIVLDNGYCRFHQDQAPEAKAPEEVCWTRERLEAAIAAHGGPEGLDLAGADLSNLDLSRIDLHGIILYRWDVESRTHIVANLQRVKLWDANLQGAELRGANLQNAILTLANLQEVDLWRANLKGAGLVGANLQEARLRRANLRETKLESANLQGAELRDANLQGADLRFADLREVDLLDVETGGLLGIRLYRAKLDRTALRKEQLGPAIGDEQAGEYREARDAYLALKQNFEGLGDYEAANWSYIKERQMEKACSAPWRARRFYGNEQLGDRGYRVYRDRDICEYEYKRPAYHPQVWRFFVRHFFKWLLDWLVELVCGYGERPRRTVGAMVVVFAVFVGIYWATWAVMKVEHTPEATVLVPTRNLVDLLVFGLGVFTTMDPKGLEPRATWVQLVAGFEALLGIGLTGLFGFVLGNRIRRS